MDSMLKWRRPSAVATWAALVHVVGNRGPRGEERRKRGVRDLEDCIFFLPISRPSAREGPAPTVIVICKFRKPSHKLRLTLSNRKGDGCDSP